MAADIRSRLAKATSRRQRAAAPLPASIAAVVSPGAKMQIDPAALPLNLVVYL
jgi:hypothetical protein